MTGASGNTLSAMAALAILAGAPLAAQAQIVSPVPPTGSAGALPNLTVYQRQLGQSMDRFCPAMEAAPNLDRVQATLLARCGEMVSTANQILGQPVTGPTLGLNNQQMAAAMGQLAGEEIQTPRIQITEIHGAQVQAIGARLDAIRQGLGGFGVAGIGGIGGYGVSSGQQYASLAAVETAQQPETGASTLLARLGGFITGGIGFGDVDNTEYVSGFDYDTREVTLGVDYRLTNNAAVGIALGYSRFDADYNQIGGEKLDSDTWIVSLYGSYFVSDRLFLDGTLSYARGNYDLTRRVVYATFNRTATGDFDTDLYGASVSGGYRLLPFSGVETTLLGGVDYVHASVDGFSETGAEWFDLRYSSSDIDSLRGHVGVEVARPISTGIGVIRPAVTGRFIHEFLDEGMDTRVSFVNDPTGLSTFVLADRPVDRNFFNVGAQLSAQFAGGIAAFASYDTVLGLEDVTSHLFQVGLRMEF